MRNITKSKRGQLQTLYPAVLTFVLVGLLLAIGFLILGELITQIAEVTDDGSGTMANLTCSSCSNKTYTTLATTFTPVKSCSITCVNNGTGVSGELGGAGLTCIQAANYSDLVVVEPTGCSFKLNTHTQFNASSVNVTFAYVYDIYNTAYKTVNDTVNATIKFVDFLPIIAIAIVAAIILAIVIGAFVIRGRRSIG